MSGVRIGDVWAQKRTPEKIDNVAFSAPVSTSLSYSLGRLEKEKDRV
jgi:hypothetical protein